jgi:EmrB/QacA subfamily drug resistance transporter
MPRLSNILLFEPAPLASLQNRPWSSWLVVGLVCVGAFVGQVDATIVQLALPTLGHVYDAPLQTISWVALSYLLAYASFLPIFGRLCEILGRKSLYIAGYLLFILASALCGLAANLEQLLAFRFLQGIGGALLGANSLSILVATVPAESRGRALGLYAAAQAIGMSAGPALGGFILEALGWRWIFWVTVPFGAAAVILGWLALPRSSARGVRQAFDWGGMLLVGPALILLVAALNHLSSWGLVSPYTIGCIAVAAALFWLLFRHEAASPSPLINPRLYRTAAYRSGALAVTLAYALLYAMFFLMSFALEHGYGETPSHAGLRLALIPVALGLTALFSHDLKSWLGSSRIAVAGMLLCLCGVTTLLFTLKLSPDHHVYDTLAFILIGTGLGLFIAPNFNATIADVTPDLHGPAGSLLNLMRALGTSLGVAAGATTLNWRLEAQTGAVHGWQSSSSESLLAAVRESLPVLIVIAVVAALTARAAAAGARPDAETSQPR